MSIAKPRGQEQNPPKIVQSFFKRIDILRALGYRGEHTGSRIVWDFWTQDPHYEKFIEKKLPVFLGFSGGKTQKQNFNKPLCDGCLVIVGESPESPESPYGMIAESGRLIGQVGNPAIGMFE